MRPAICSAALALLLVPALTGCAHAASGATTRHEAGLLYDRSADAAQELAAALTTAAQDGRKVLAVFGANWCHDSRALAEALTTGESGTVTRENFVVAFIDVGQPQTGEGRNQDIAAPFVGKMEGTPALVVLNAAGERQNSREDAASWRDAASRSETEIIEMLRYYAQPD